MEKLELMLFLRRQPCEDLVLKQAGRFYTPLFSCHSLSPPKWALLLLWFEVDFSQCARKHKALHAQQESAGCLELGARADSSENNKYYKQQASVEHTEVLWELLFPEKTQTPESTSPGCGKGWQPDGHRQNSNKSGCINISMHSCPWVRTQQPNTILTLHTQRLGGSYAQSSLDKPIRNQSSTKVCPKKHYQDHCTPTATDRWEGREMKSSKAQWKMHILRCSLLIFLEGLPLFWKPFQIKDSSRQGQKRITES